MTAPDLHPDAAPLAGLLGTWEGQGHGDYPTIDPFDYVETVTFGHVGKPFLAYSQRTRRLTAEGPAEPLHAETGYLRPVGDGHVELAIAHPTGIVEVHAGTFAGGVLDLASDAVATTRTAKDVRSVRRRVEVDGDVLRYDVWMAAVGHPETHHLRAELRRGGAL